jgi:phosphatidate cytidylyltransferase
VIILPLLILFILYAGPALFNGGICLLTALALNEFYTMGLPAGRRGEACLAVSVGVVLTGLVVYRPEPSLQMGVAVFLILGLMVVFLFRPQEIAAVGRDAAVTVLGLAYISLLLAHAGLLRGLVDGRVWVFLVIFLVMVSDSAAYFIGRSFGRHKLYEVISPKKTIEGSLGGLLGGVLGVLVFRSLFFPQLGVVDVLVLGGGVGAFSQIGDLFESMLKRSFGVKDSGRLIPGHGGVLDRLDSLLFAFPVTYYYAVWFFRG